MTGVHVRPADGTADPDHGHRDRRQHGEHLERSERRFAGVVGWTLLGSLVPGLGYAVSGRRRLGRAVLAVTCLALVGLVLFVLAGDPVRLARSVALDPQRLLWTAVAVVVLAVAWVVLVVTTHLAVRRGVALGGLQRAGCGVLVAVLVAVGVLPAARVAGDALLARDTLTTVFAPASASASAPAPGTGGGERAEALRPQTTQADPWASVPRVNVLLIGSDAGADREGVRPDTLIVASIDTRSGDTVLFSLPRNLQRVPFPPGSAAAAAYPGGFVCTDPTTGTNTECLLNGVWTFAEDHAGDYYKGVRNPGLTATVQAAEQVTGLSIDDYVLVDLQGFKEIVDAVGGLTLDVKERLPIGGNAEDPSSTTGWLDTGVQKLDGYHALWFARSRWSTSDYDRMRRQRCVLGALSEQADPVTLAANFPALARAAERNIQTDIRVDELDAWVTLAERVRGAQVRSLPFTDDVIDTVRPDFTRVHKLVRQALRAPSASAPSVQPAPTPSASAKPATPKPSASPAPATRATSVDAVC